MSKITQKIHYYAQANELGQPPKKFQVDRKPDRVWVVPGSLLDDSLDVYRPSHGHNAWLQDRGHDWTWSNGWMKFTGPGRCYLLFEYDEVEAAHGGEQTYASMTVEELLSEIAKWDIRFDGAKWYAYPAYVAAGCGSSGPDLAAALRLALRRAEADAKGCTHEELRAITCLEGSAR
jgi:hypothetical protein